MSNLPVLRPVSNNLEMVCFMNEIALMRNILTRDKAIEILRVVCEDVFNNRFNRIEEFILQWRNDPNYSVELFDDAKSIITNMITLSAGRTACISDNDRVTFIPEVRATEESFGSPVRSCDSNIRLVEPVYSEDALRYFRCALDAHEQIQPIQIRQLTIFQRTAVFSENIIEFIDDLILPINPPVGITYRKNDNWIIFSTKGLLRSLYSILFGCKQFVWRPIKSWVFSPLSTVMGIANVLHRLFTEPREMLSDIMNQVAEYALNHPIEFATEFMLNIGAIIYATNFHGTKSTIKDASPADSTAAVASNEISRNVGNPNVINNIHKPSSVISAHAKNTLANNPGAPLYSGSNPNIPPVTTMRVSAAPPLPPSTVNVVNVGSITTNSASTVSSISNASTLVSTIPFTSGLTNIGSNNITANEEKARLDAMINVFTASSYILKLTDEKKYFDTLRSIRMQQFRLSMLLDMK